MSRPTRVIKHKSMLRFRIRGYHSLWRSLPAASTSQAGSLTDSLSGDHCMTDISINQDLCHGRLILTTPFKHWADTHTRFRRSKNLKSLDSSPFARHYLGNHWLFSLPHATKMFQFAWYPLTVLCVQTAVTGHYSSRVSPFRHPRIKACLAANRGFSQPTTSFVGILYLGIHRMPFSNLLY